MIKVSSLEKYGIKLDAKDKLSQAFGQKVVTEFARRDMLMLDDLSLGDICVTVGNDIGYDNTEIEQIHVCDVIPRLWAYWKPSMDWLVQQELAGYKDETDYFGEAVPVEIPTETPEEKEALDAIEKKSPYDVGAHVSDASKPVYTQAMADAGELPPVGSEYKTSGGQFTSIIHGQEDGRSTVCGKASDGYIAIHWLDICKPIQTERDASIGRALRASTYSGDVMKNVILGAIEKIYDAGLLK